MSTKSTGKEVEKKEPKQNQEIITWSASSWEAWKRCPLKFKIRADKWSKPQMKPDRRTAVYAFPGTMADKLFELFLFRGEYKNEKWLQENFDMVWNMMLAKRKPKFKDDKECQELMKQVKASVSSLYSLISTHRLLEGNDYERSIGIQESFHFLVSEQIAIVGAMDFWKIQDDGKVLLFDFKYARVDSWRRRSIDQLHFYALALERILGSPPDNIGYICFHPDNPGIIQRRYRRCDTMKLLSRLERASEMRAANEFPHKYHPFYCGKFCDIRFGCPEFKKTLSR